MESHHRKIVELIPWYVNGTLSAEERSGIEVHLRECLPCRATLREQQRLRGLVRAQDDIPIGAAGGMSDLLRRIDRSGVPAALSRFPPRRAYAGAGAVVAIAIAAWFALTSPMTRDTGEPVGSFTTLTDDAGAAANRIDIVLADAVPANQLSDILDSLGAELIGGPSQLGRYTIAVGAESEDELSAMIDRLTRDPRVRFAGRSFSASQSPGPVEP